MAAVTRTQGQGRQPPAPALRARPPLPYPIRARVPLLDVVRGLAILLMMLDHVARVGGFPGWVHYFTRPALPLFMVTMGFLWRGGLRWRHVQLVGAAALSWPLALLLGIAQVPVLVALVLALPMIVGAHHAPLLGTVVGIMAVANIEWVLHGYHPGLLLALVSLGMLARGRPIPDLGIRSRWLESIGKRPLTWYVGHLAVLAAVVLL